MNKKTHSPELDGRLAVVTGGGAGIGEGICRVLAAHGARVVCIDLDIDRARQVIAAIASEGGADGIALAHDVSDWEASRAVIGRIEAEAGAPVDILVNNAGIYFNAPLTELDERDHERLYAVNVGGVLSMCRAVAGPMTERRSGRIVNIASISGRDPFPKSASYGSSKAAVLGITKSLAKELGPHNINVNAVCPGFVHTSMQVDQCRKIAAATGQSEEAVWQSRVDLVPLKRAQTIEDIGEAVAFLASDRARSITGQGLSVCGGLQMHG